MRTGRTEHIGLHGGPFDTAIICFVCADLFEPDARLPARFKGDLYSKNVRLDEDAWRLDASVHMRLGSKVHHSIRFLHERSYKLTIADIASDDASPYVGL